MPFSPKPRDWFRLLPSGNSDQFPKIAKLLKRRRVQAYELVTRGGGRIFCVPQSQLTKLPRDSEGYYLPVDMTSGFSIYHMHDIAEYSREIGARPLRWNKI